MEVTTGVMAEVRSKASAKMSTEALMEVTTGGMAKMTTEQQQG